MSELMSQQEIDEMIRLSLLSTDGQGADPIAVGESALSPVEIDTLGEIGNISMGSAATALHAILGRKVVITTPDVTITTIDQLTRGQMVPYVMVDVEYSEGFVGHNLFILRLDDVKVITDIMMGGPGELQSGELSELHLSAISEAMNQMMGGVATAMADMFGRVVNIAPPRTKVIMLSDRDIRELIVSHHEELVRISFKMEIEGLLDSSIMQLMPLFFGKQLVESAMHPGQAPEPQSPADPANIPGAGIGFGTPAARTPASSAATPAAPGHALSAPGLNGRAGGSARLPAAPERKPSIDVRPIELTCFDQNSMPAMGPAEGALDMILDVPLQVTVELGQCRKTIKEVLDLNIGSVVSLDTLAGEPVDVVVNGKCVAKGEVIVIDDNYGIRITEVLSQRRVRAQNA